MTETVGADPCVCPETSTAVFRADTRVRPYSFTIEPVRTTCDGPYRMTVGQGQDERKKRL